MLLLLWLSGISAPQVQVGVPMFRAGVYVVPVQITFFRKRPDGPDLTLRPQDFGVFLDEDLADGTQIVQNESNRNEFSFYVPVPDRLRDGKRHVIAIRVRGSRPGIRTKVLVPKRPHA